MAGAWKSEQASEPPEMNGTHETNKRRIKQELGSSRLQVQQQQVMAYA